MICWVVAGIGFSSCEDDMFLRSEKKMRHEIQGTWERQTQGVQAYASCPGIGDSIPYTENWVFTDDNLYTTFNYGLAMPCDRGTPDKNFQDKTDTAIVAKFKIDARIFDAFLKLQLVSGADDTAYAFIDKWEFVTLDHDVLYLATDDPKSGSVRQVEFYKIK